MTKAWHKNANRFFENEAKVIYLETTLTLQNCMYKENKSRLNSRNACYRPVHGLLSFLLLSEDVKVKICKTIILPVILYGCETWSLTLREEHRQRALEKRVLRRIFKPKGDEVMGDWRYFNSEELHKLYSSSDIIRQMKSRGMRWAGMWRAWERKEKLGNFEGKRPLERPRRRWEDGIRMDLRKIGLGVWSGVIWIRVGTRGRLF
jgi:hypothetical protein